MAIFTIEDAFLADREKDKEIMRLRSLLMTIIRLWDNPPHELSHRMDRAIDAAKTAIGE